MTTKPTYDELLAMLGKALSEYTTIDLMLDDFMASALSGASRADELAQRKSNRVFNQLQRAYLRALPAREAA